MTTWLIGLLLILLITIFIGTPISFGLGFTAIAGIMIFIDPNQLNQPASIMYDLGTSVNQLIVPLFILMAEILAQGKIASDIFTVISKWTGKLRGGLAISATLAATVFAALCGSSPATAATIGRISISEMTKRGYKPDFAAGVVAAGGTLGIMIPPSIAMVVFGIITENSIAKLFIAGLLPGLMISGILILYILIVGRFSPQTVGHTANAKKVAATSELIPSTLETPTTFLQDMGVIIPPFGLIMIVLGSIYTGTATPIEAAGVGAVGALILAIILRRLNMEVVKNIFSSTARTSAMVIFLIFGGMTLSYVVSYLGLAQSMADLIIGLSVNKWVVLTGVYILWFILGMLVDPLSMIILTVPFMYPTLLKLGFDPIWLGVVSTLAVEIGLITPPVGLNLFVIKGISDIPMNKIIRGSIPFVGVLILCLIILTFFPIIATYLPSKM